MTFEFTIYCPCDIGDNFKVGETRIVEGNDLLAWLDELPEPWTLTMKIGLESVEIKKHKMPQADLKANATVTANATVLEN